MWHPAADHDSHTAAHDADPHRLRGRTLLAARLALAATIVMALFLFTASLPFDYARNATLCRSTPCEGVRLDATAASALQSLGFSLSFYAGYVLAGEVLIVAVYTSVAILIAWRRSDDRAALFVATTLVTWSIAAFAPSLSALRAANPLWSLPVALLSALGGASFICFCYVFPDGRFLPRWTRWTALIWSLLYLPHAIAPTSPWDISTLPPLAEYAFWSCFLATVAAAQVWRYRRVSTSLQRQQAKWVLLDLLLGLFGLLGVILAVLLTFPHSGASALFIAAFFGLPVLCLAILLIPVSIVIAMLRYQLFDIDILLNRALVYGALTSALALVYAVSVIVIQTILGSLITNSDDTQFAIVASTLLIAALFGPLRRRIQNAIDRRFYRRKYDAARTVAAFAATLRSEVDLTALSDNLVAVVDETIQPTHISLWLQHPLPTRSRRMPATDDPRRETIPPTHDDRQ